MKCIFCGSIEDKVIDSRLNEDGTSIRRRRECCSCGRRFTTYETIEFTPIMVVKKYGERQEYSRTQLKQGIVNACAKRPVSMETIDKLVAEVEKKINNSLEQEIKSSVIGEYVMEGLKDIDDVAYIRFAAVYREFKDINSWLSEIKDLVKEKK